MPEVSNLPIALSDLAVSWTSESLPRRIAPFETRGVECQPPNLTVSVESSREPLVFPRSELSIGVSSFARHVDGSLFAWNDYKGHPERSALLELPRFDRALVRCGPKSSECSVLNMLFVAFLPVVARNNGLALHASLVKHGSRAVAFTASSGTGKSTQADLWHEYLGAEIMNGDRALVRRLDGGWRAYGSPWAGSSPYIKNEKAPLAGIVVLRQAPENQIRRLNAAEVMAYLYNNVRLPFWDEGATAASLGTLDALIREIPIFLLECRPDEEAVRITRDAVFGTEA